MKCSITVTEENSAGNEIVGGFYSPSKRIPKERLSILNKHNFNYNIWSYCDGKFWPDNKTGEHTLLIFSTNQPLIEAIGKLQKLVKDNV